jgi:uncharacterized protein (DUF1778 family)
MPRTTIEVEPEIHASIKRIAESRGTKVKALTRWMLIYALERIEHIIDQQQMKGLRDGK